MFQVNLLDFPGSHGWKKSFSVKKVYVTENGYSQKSMKNFFGSGVFGMGETFEI